VVVAPLRRLPNQSRKMTSTLIQRNGKYLLRTSLHLYFGDPLVTSTAGPAELPASVVPRRSSFSTPTSYRIIFPLQRRSFRALPPWPAAARAARLQAAAVTATGRSWPGHHGQALSVLSLATGAR